MAPFFHGTQIDMAVSFIRNLHAKNFSVKRLGYDQVSDIQTGVAEADSVEAWVKVRGGNWHFRLLW
tara:strand:+ start:1169 stop:1366 length:198 start_codon:yes stop_codon:yes gene_type:complete